MALTNLLPAGSGSATSAPFALGAGQTMTLAGAARPPGASYWRAQLQRQMSDGLWQDVGALDWQRPMLVLYGEGTYRLQRLAGQGGADGGCMVDGAGV